MLKLDKIESSNIKSIGYCDITKTLGVKFKNEKLYLYLMVPENVWDELQESDSKGSYLSSIKSNYVVTQIQE